MTEAELQSVHQAMEAVERKRQENAERIAGCPLERWAEGRINYFYRGTPRSLCRCCWCHCHDKGKRAA